MRGHVERVFLLWARPLAPLLCIGAYGILELFRPETPSERILVPLGLSVATALVYVGLLRPLGTRRVLQVLVVVDTFLIATMTVALREPEVLAIAYFWSIALAAFFLGHRETIVATAVAAACAAIVPYVAERSPNLVVVVTDVIVLALIGGLLSLLAAQREDAEDALLAQGQLDAAALRIAERVRSSLDLDDVLQQTAEEIALHTGASRGLVWLPGPGAPFHQWVRDGFEPIGVDGAPPTAARILASGEPFVVRDVSEAPADVREYFGRHGTVASVGVPVVWQGEVVCVLGLHDDRPRDWERDGLPLLRVIAPQVAAALAQARAYHEVQDVAEMRETLVANVSHELRTPLTSTLGFLRTLERDDIELDAARRAELVTIARQEAERLALLVEDLLKLASARHGALDLRDDVDVADVVRRAATGLPLAGRELRTRIPSGLCVRADRDRLVQVLTNLLSNALQHGSGAVVVAAERREESVAVVVADEGPGLPAEQAEEVFAPFARWNPRTSGTGLGLAISRAIAVAHGGTLAYENRAFVLRLPA